MTHPNNRPVQKHAGEVDIHFDVNQMARQRPDGKLTEIDGTVHYLVLRPIPGHPEEGLAFIQSLNDEGEVLNTESFDSASEARVYWSHIEKKVRLEGGKVGKATMIIDSKLQILKMQAESETDPALKAEKALAYVQALEGLSKGSGEETLAEDANQVALSLRQAHDRLNVLKHDAEVQGYSSVTNRVDDWQTQIEQIMSSMNYIVDMGKAQGGAVQKYTATTLEDASNKIGIFARECHDVGDALEAKKDIWWSAGLHQEAYTLENIVRQLDNLSDTKFDKAQGADLGKLSIRPTPQDVSRDIADLLDQAEQKAEQLAAFHGLSELSREAVSMIHAAQAIHDDIAGVSFMLAADAEMQKAIGALPISEIAKAQKFGSQLLDAAEKKNSSEVSRIIAAMRSLGQGAYDDLISRLASFLRTGDYAGIGRMAYNLAAVGKAQGDEMEKAVSSLPDPALGSIAHLKQTADKTLADVRAANITEAYVGSMLLATGGSMGDFYMYLNDNDRKAITDAGANLHAKIADIFYQGESRPRIGAPDEAKNAKVRDLTGEAEQLHQMILTAISRKTRKAEGDDMGKSAGWEPSSTWKDAWRRMIGSGKKQRQVLVKPDGDKWVLVVRDLDGKELKTAPLAAEDRESAMRLADKWVRENQVAVGKAQEDEIDKRQDGSNDIITGHIRYLKGAGYKFEPAERVNDSPRWFVTKPSGERVKMNAEDLAHEEYSLNGQRQ